MKDAPNNHVWKLIQPNQVGSTISPRVSELLFNSNFFSCFLKLTFLYINFLKGVEGASGTFDGDVSIIKWKGASLYVYMCTCVLI